MQFPWRSPAIRGLQSDCRYVNNNEQITCRSHARALGANDGDGGPLRIQRVIARDLGYESNGWVKIVVVLTAIG